MATAKPLRLRRSEDFRACYEKGHMHRGSLVVVHVLPNSLPVTRIGYSVSKRLGKAVQRNRVRRRLQAIMREYDLVPGYDIVVAARVRAKDATFAELKKGVDTVLRRAKLVQESSHDEPGGDGS